MPVNPNHPQSLSLLLCEEFAADFEDDNQVSYRSLKYLGRSTTSRILALGDPLERARAYAQERIPRVSPEEVKISSDNYIYSFGTSLNGADVTLHLWRGKDDRASHWVEHSVNWVEDMSALGPQNMPMSTKGSTIEGLLSSMGVWAAHRALREEILKSLEDDFKLKKLDTRDYDDVIKADAGVDHLLYGELGAANSQSCQVVAAPYSNMGFMKVHVYFRK